MITTFYHNKWVYNFFTFFKHKSHTIILEINETQPRQPSTFANGRLMCVLLKITVYNNKLIS